jgi:hypothetical protein
MMWKLPGIAGKYRRVEDFRMWAVRILHGILKSAIRLCFIALACLVIYFPFVHMGEILIYPFWRWPGFVNRLTVEDGLTYLFLTALLCSMLQILESSVSRLISGERAEQ